VSCSWLYLLKSWSLLKTRGGSEWFRSRQEARVVIKEWMAHYNEVRPHSSLGYKTPREFVEQLAPKGKSGEAEVNMAVA
jgi:transposase InsO family protein